MSTPVDVSKQRASFAALPPEAQERLRTRWQHELATHRNRHRAAIDLGDTKAAANLEKAASVIEEILKP